MTRLTVKIYVFENDNDVLRDFHPIAQRCMYVAQLERLTNTYLRDPLFCLFSGYVWAINCECGGF